MNQAPDDTAAFPGTAPVAATAAALPRHLPANSVLDSCVFTCQLIQADLTESFQPA